MAQKYLFEKFSSDKRIYNLNQGYWKRKLKSKLKLKFTEDSILFKNIDFNGLKIYDANPIFTYIDKSKGKAIRIIQDDFDLINDNEIEDVYLLTAWFDVLEDNRNQKEKKIQELVIALFLTQETVEKSIELIRRWLNDEIDQENINSLVK